MCSTCSELARGRGGCTRAGSGWGGSDGQRDSPRGHRGCLLLLPLLLLLGRYSPEACRRLLLLQAVRGLEHARGGRARRRRGFRPPAKEVVKGPGGSEERGRAAFVHGWPLDPLGLWGAGAGAGGGRVPTPGHLREDRRATAGLLPPPPRPAALTMPLLLRPLVVEKGVLLTLLRAMDVGQLLGGELGGGTRLMACRQGVRG